jgi:CDP-diacylglycerol---glycerol-3-phosphate 3-phosphatidyltransferase
MFVALKKHRTFAFIHTYGNKITGLVIFIFPLFIQYVDINILMYILCVIASTSAIEELIIQLTSNKLQVNKKSIFSKE